MKRRDFTNTLGLLGAAGWTLLPQYSQWIDPKYKLGLQLFSIHDDMVEDPLKTLKAVKQMGYQDFEIYGFDPDQLTYYNLPAKNFKTILDDLQLSVTSGHYGFSEYLDKPLEDLRRFVDQCIKGAHRLNSPYITWPWLAPEQRTIDNFKLMAERLNQIGAQVLAAGLGFAYHNHGFEFEKHDGQTGYDIILQDTDPDLVKLQMDMYWVMHSSDTTPKQLVQEHPGRFVMWHIKDMDKETRDYTELGNGTINYVEILPDPEESGLEYYYIEQGGNFTHSALQSAADSAKYFKKNLQRFL